MSLIWLRAWFASPGTRLWRPHHVRGYWWLSLFLSSFWVWRFGWSYLTIIKIILLFRTMIGRTVSMKICVSASSDAWFCFDFDDSPNRTPASACVVVTLFEKQIVPLDWAWLKFHSEMILVQNGCRFVKLGYFLWVLQHSRSKSDQWLVGFSPLKVLHI